MVVKVLHFKLTPCSCGCSLPLMNMQGRAEILAAATRFPRLRVPIKLLSCEVRAGFPSPADDHIEGEFDLNELLISNPPATFLLRASGLSMIEDKIFDGDLLIVDRSIEPRNAHIVIASLDGEFTIKRLRKTEDRLWLEPANAAFPLLEIGPERDFQVWGVVKSKVTQFIV